MSLSAGARLGPYEIISALGAGGMGEVYRARDTRLNREVALKLLPIEVSNDPIRKQRFEQEARAVAALNHPNIVAVHDVGNENGVFWIVSELVDGAPLGSTPLTTRKKLDIAAQIADGLAAAHAAGFTHRDLKPANILVTRDGRAKILDFGLAKYNSANPESDENTWTETKPGTVMGTANYMSPEQVRAQPVDHRSDIFSFGVVLHELLTGAAPFRRDTSVETMNAILKEDAPDLPETVPAGVREIVAHCLEKERANRFQSAHDLSFALASLAHMSNSGASGSNQAILTPIAQPPRRWPGFVGIAVLLLALGILAGKFVWKTPQTPEWSGVMLGGPTTALAPRVSPDGRAVAFLAIIDDVSQVGVMNPDSGNWIVLTKDKTKGYVSELTWSPDGAQIYFDRLADGPRGVFSVPALGGEARIVLEDAANPQALPDGSLLLERINAQRQNQLFRFWPDTGRLQPLPIECDFVTHSGSVAVFPDGGEAVVYGRLIAESGAASVNHVFLVDLKSGQARRFAPQIPLDGITGTVGVTRDGRSVLAVLPAGNLFRIIAVPRDGRSSPRTLMTATDSPRVLEFGPDGSLYTDDLERPMEVLRFPVAGGIAERMASFRITPAAHMMAILRDGRVLVSSLMGGREQLVTVERGKEPARLINTTEETAAPATVVGETEIAFLIGPVPRQTIAIASLANGRILRRIALGKGTINAIAASPDGTVLYCAAGGSIWALPAQGGEPKKIRAGDFVVVDPSGKELLIQLNEKDHYRLVKVPVAGGAEQEVPLHGSVALSMVGLAPEAIGKDGRVLLPGISMDSSFWYPAVLDSTSGNVTRIPVDSRNDFHYMGWTPDGRVVAVTLGLRGAIWRFRRQP